MRFPRRVTYRFRVRREPSAPQTCRIDENTTNEASQDCTGPFAQQKCALRRIENVMFDKFVENVIQHEREDELLKAAKRGYVETNAQTIHAPPPPPLCAETAKNASKSSPKKETTFFVKSTPSPERLLSTGLPRKAT